MGSRSQTAEEVLAVFPSASLDTNQLWKSDPGDYPENEGLPAHLTLLQIVPLILRMGICSDCIFLPVSP